MIFIENIRNKVWLVNKYGLGYFIKRLIYTLKKKIHLKQSGINISTFEAEKTTHAISLRTKATFFISGKNNIAAPKTNDHLIKITAEQIFGGIYPYFQTSQFIANATNKWHFNPNSGYIYSADTHWSKLNDFSSKHGDIKFVWELSRFCYIYDIIRYDHHFTKDSSQFVFAEIENWIISNPYGQGPNYISSQEIAIRLLNWIYALHYYSESTTLNTYYRDIITNSIYQQTKHIDNELYFSKNFVRNNHLLSESLALFTVGLIFPQFKESESWIKKGHSIFSKEIIFQFDTDGAYIQHSFNYQRVAMQLSTWFLQLCTLNKIDVENNVKQRLTKSVDFMLSFIGNKKTGELPNFGNNDGSLFFPLNSEPYLNYYPQIQALAAALNYNIIEHIYEDIFWFNLNNLEIKQNAIQSECKNFNEEGYYVALEENAMTFLWCPKLKNRPAQADMLHLDVWHNGENILHDSGTYMYNTSDQERNFFFGSRSHNTILYQGKDIMKKGARFIFYNWPKKINGNVKFESDSFIFTAQIKIYPSAGIEDVITRQVIKRKGKAEWEITDTLKNSSQRYWTQLWNISDSFLSNFNIDVVDENKIPVESLFVESYTSTDYGIKTNSTQLQFSTPTRSLKTTITKK